MIPARVVIAHNPAGAADDPSTADVLDQVAAVEAGLRELGIPSVRAAVAGREVFERLGRENRAGTVIFNLIESPPGNPNHHCAATAALELLGLPFTGSSSAALWATTDKLATRALLAAEGLAVAPGGRLDLEDPEVLGRVPPPWILKPSWEDASVGLEGDPTASARGAALARGRELSQRFPRQPVLVERLLPGREFNVSLLADGNDGVEVLPIAEMTYRNFPEGMPRVLGYDAKWSEGSFASENTVREFPDGPEDEPLLERIRHLALAAWKACGLSGYARIDLRLDEHGEPCVLEANGNPCLSADAGFMASAAKAGLGPGDVVRRILRAARSLPSNRGEDANFGVADEAEGSSPLSQPSPSQGGGTLRFTGVDASDLSPLVVRRGLELSDRQPLEELIKATGFFNPEEVDVALELVDDRLAQGEASHYRFLVGEIDGQVAGYACWGPIPGTESSVDLYWIVVHPDRQGRGIGAGILRAAEAWIGESGKTRIYVETSTRGQYAGTRRFYFACGYELASELPDFYAPGDGKATFIKVLAQRRR